MTEKKKPTPKKHRKKAVAIRYDKKQDAAPKVVGKGVGQLAEKIIALAKEHDIPIHEDSDLAEILSRLDLHAEIPPSAYVVVAEILAFVYRTNDNFKT